MGALGTREGAGLAFLRSLCKRPSTACIEYPYGSTWADEIRVVAD